MISLLMVAAMLAAEGEAPKPEPAPLMPAELRARLWRGQFERATVQQQLTRIDGSLKLVLDEMSAICAKVKGYLLASDAQGEPYCAPEAAAKPETPARPVARSQPPVKPK